MEWSDNRRKGAIAVEEEQSQVAESDPRWREAQVEGSASGGEQTQKRSQVEPLREQ